MTYTLPAHLHTLMHMPHLHHDIANTIVASHTHTYGHTSFGAAPASHGYSDTTHSRIHSTYVLSCLDERTACMNIFSSNVCAFS